MVFNSVSEGPEIVGGDPGPEAIEIAEIAAWFQDRGIVLLWDGRGPAGWSPGTPMRITTHWANLLDLEADEHLARFEAPLRVEAVRRAQKWWEEAREGVEESDKRVIEQSGGATSELSGGGSVELPRPHLTPPDLAGLKLHGFVIWFTEPDPEDPESRWLAVVSEVETARIIDFATGYTAEEALITVRPSIQPPDDRA